jgi:hypothetical protein
VVKAPDYRKSLASSLFAYLLYAGRIEPKYRHIKLAKPIYLTVWLRALLLNFVTANYANSNKNFMLIPRERNLSWK